jgi:hypothetical protein
MVSPSHLGVGAAIAIGLATSLASSSQAQAQDLNLQTQLNIFAPPVTVVPLTSVGKESALNALNNCGSKSKFFAENPDLIDFLKANPDVTIDDLIALSSQFQERFNEFLQTRHPNAGANAKRKTKFLLPPASIDFNCAVQQTKFKATFPVNPTYETDVLKKGDNSSSGVSAGFGSNFLLTTAGGRPFDLIAIGAGETSVRYPSFSSASVDAVTSQLFYQAFLQGYGYLKDGQPVPDIEKYTGGQLVPGLITFDTISFGVQNQTAFTPTFNTEKANLLTPQVTIARQNIDLDDPGRADIMKCNIQAQGFCHYADLSLTVGQTFSDVLSQQNFNVAGSGAIGWRIDSTWKLALQLIATGKDYEDFVGGRQDVLLQVGPVLSYNPNNNVSFSLPISYFKNYSTVSAAAWSGLVVQPTLSIALTYAPTAAMPK